MFRWQTEIFSKISEFAQKFVDPPKMLKVLAFRRLQKESQQQKIKERYFTNAKMESITARNRKFDSDVENTALNKKIQDVSAEAYKSC